MINFLSGREHFTTFEQLGPVQYKHFTNTSHCNAYQFRLLRQKLRTKAHTLELPMQKKLTGHQLLVDAAMGKEYRGFLEFLFLKETYNQMNYYYPTALSLTHG